MEPSPKIIGGTNGRDGQGRDRKGNYSKLIHSIGAPFLNISTKNIRPF